MKGQMSIDEYINLVEEDDEERRERKVRVKRIGPALPHDEGYERMKAKWLSPGITAADMIRN